MALIKTVQMPSGVNVSYWRIVRISLEPRRALVTVVGYKSTVERSEEKGLNEDQLKVVVGAAREYEWKGDNNPFTGAAMRANLPVDIAYAKLKTLPEWSGSADDITE